MPLPTEQHWTLRSATVQDVEAIARIWHDAWHDGHAGHVPQELYVHRTLATFLERARSRVISTTVADDGPVRPVGFVTVHDDELEQLFVAAEGRGTGIATSLLRHGEKLIAVRHSRAWLAVATENARARHFYEKLGWEDEGALDYAAEVPGGTVSVPCRRYGKRLRGE